MRLVLILVLVPFFSVNGQGKLLPKIEAFGGPASVGYRNDKSYQKAQVFDVGYTAGLSLTQSIIQRFALNVKVLWDVKGFKQIYHEMLPPDIYNNPPTQNLPPVPTKIVLGSASKYLTFVFGPRYNWGPRGKLKTSVGIYYSVLKAATGFESDTQNGQLKYNFTGSNKCCVTPHDSGLSMAIAYDLLKATPFLISGQVMENLGLTYAQNHALSSQPQMNNSVSLQLVVSFVK